MRFEPKRPVLAVEVMEQGKCQAIGRLLEGSAIFEKVGARDDDEFGGNEPSGLKSGILSQTMPDCQIDRFSPQIDRAGSRLHGNFNIRVTLREHRKPRHQPGRRE